MEMATLNSMDYMREIALCQLHRTIKYADVRCASPAKVIRKILDTTDEDERSACISRLLELRLKRLELKLLQRAATTLVRRCDSAPAALKTGLDRTLLRIVRVLPSNLASSFAEPYICHSRKTIRERAYSALRNKRIPLGVARELVTVFRRTGDQEALELIARNPKLVPDIDSEFLLANIKERYWRARVIEALLLYKRSAALSLAARYPFEFAHAVGRAGDKALRVPLRGLLQANSSNLEFLSIYAYALGKIGAKEELQSLKTSIPETLGGDVIPER